MRVKFQSKWHKKNLFSVESTISIKMILKKFIVFWEWNFNRNDTKKYARVISEEKFNRKDTKKCSVVMRMENFNQTDTKNCSILTWKKNISVKMTRKNVP